MSFSFATPVSPGTANSLADETRKRAIYLPKGFAAAGIAHLNVIGSLSGALSTAALAG
ncbi:hypothetical protein [Paraburkholderia phytofirmans]|uniref:Uncharacterized protein n=2 Tax=Paraburkholderia phytofirmans TaxID=261302 RepID=B2TG97_PARPJ|nr:hypothetical protein [Paraburkholderia phytofirmans]ACD19967.1 hypothetical protein Bphyt_5620 [Paraburkholderia phytofirmans PsJN]